MAQEQQKSTVYPLPMSYEEIIRILPHRVPFLLIDRVLQINEQEIIAYKLLGASEPFFAGHFPNKPVMPGVLQLEALAQTAAIWMGLHQQDGDAIPYLTGVQSAKFRRPVTVGDRLDLQVELQGQKAGFCRFSGKGLVNGTIVCEAVLSAFIQKNSQTTT
ncbi:MAG: 3-hydroxyacyl-ACP dehydratase FabZ [Myxococcota bacterium]